MVWRIVLASNYQVQPPDIRLRWSVRDLIHAHVMLDHQEAERRRNAPAEGSGGE